MVTNMATDRKRVVYLSSTPLGEELLAWLREQPCRVVLAETDNDPVEEFPAHDLGLAFLYTRRIPERHSGVPRLWVNFHPGPLPEFRGRNLAYHAIMERSAFFGASIHYMDAGLDTGELIETVRFPIEPYHTAGDLVRMSHGILARLFKRHVPALLRGEVPCVPQGPGRYYAKEPIDDVVTLTDDQTRKIRAVTVHPRFHATTLVNGRRFRVVPEGEEGGL
jgi:methionyl-tRNA formyltransferase